MKLVIEIDENLLRLEYCLDYLENYSFNENISKILEQLRAIINNELYVKVNEAEEDIISQKMKIEFNLKKKQK